MSNFDTDLVSKLLRTETVGRRIVYSQVTGTTMEDAERGARQDGNPHGTCYIAEIQTNARGSKGRKWNAKSSGNLYMSFIIHRDKEEGIETPAKSKENDLDVSASLASLQALEGTKVSGTKLKWLNDLWVRGHKMQGALAEYKGVITVDASEKYLYILGIGLNINCDMHRDPLIYSLATSTLCESGEELLREQVFADICYHLEKNLARDRDALLDIYRQHAVFKAGDSVKVYYTESTVLPRVCTFSCINDDWTVDVKGPDGVINAACYEVSLRPVLTKVVYVLKHSCVKDWSQLLLMKTFAGLVDTSKYEVKCHALSHNNVKKGIPEDCHLLVIGEMMTPPSDPQLVSTIYEWVKMGGACLCFGAACAIFDNKESQDTGPCQRDTTIITTHYAGKNKSHVEINSISVYQGDWLSNIKYTNCSILASQNSDEHKGQNGFPNDADVIVSELGAGKMCLCGLNLEVTYADIEEFFPELSDKISCLQQTVFRRDELLITIMEKLGL